MSLETEHRGHKISYSENGDVWRCWDIDFEHPKLSGVKRKIDALYSSKKLKPTEFPVILAPSYGSPLVGCVALARTDDNLEHRVWIRKPDGPGKFTRAKERIDALAFPTEENLAKVKKLDVLSKQISALHRESEALNRSITRLTHADYQKLEIENRKDADKE